MNELRSNLARALADDTAGQIYMHPRDRRGVIGDDDFEIGLSLARSQEITGRAFAGARTPCSPRAQPGRQLIRRMGAIGLYGTPIV
jgi:hypothetical protein